MRCEAMFCAYNDVGICRKRILSIDNQGICKESLKQGQKIASAGIDPRTNDPRIQSIITPVPADCLIDGETVDVEFRTSTNSDCDKMSNNLSNVAQDEKEGE